jgi:hypothetical protein
MGYGWGVGGGGWGWGGMEAERLGLRRGVAGAAALRRHGRHHLARPLLHQPGAARGCCRMVRMEVARCWSSADSFFVEAL